MTTLISELKAQIERATEILKDYKSIGQPGIFGAMMIELDLDRACKALDDNDVAGMIYWEKTLSELKQ